MLAVDERDEDTLDEVRLEAWLRAIQAQQEAAEQRSEALLVARLSFDPAI